MNSMTPECRHLFVYGTLRRGSPNVQAEALARENGFVGPAKVQGRLYRVDWYPGMIPSNVAGEWIHGEVFRLADPEATLRRLDDYEGSEFARIVGQAFVNDTEPIACWIYVYRGRPAEETRIASGEFTPPVQRR